MGKVEKSRRGLTDGLVEILKEFGTDVVCEVRVAGEKAEEVRVRVDRGGKVVAYRVLDVRGREVERVL